MHAHTYADINHNTPLSLYYHSGSSTSYVPPGGDRGNGHFANSGSSIPTTTLTEDSVISARKVFVCVAVWLCGCVCLPAVFQTENSSTDMLCAQTTSVSAARAEHHRGPSSTGSHCLMSVL